MTLNGDQVPALFLSAPTLDGADEAKVSFDGSEEAMRRLRHPFAVGPELPATATGKRRDRGN
ncbi:MULTISPECIES: hypothetical protein [Micromonospora]|uniref:Uncharacterized protein n=1 Tax=Micromonospora yangpuensis TaxID=683228 RepID=A0A1C6U1Q5_9ACTN|nr:hypothetical protein [Micromonospora yangpuensis]GGM10730.1 hypothetical protein GCM10012279_30930 [Micromonospora yangpuensis]SCL48015.1 hypothetical protein GA0070617_0750 [Micromonospora yangpuensis]